MAKLILVILFAIILVVIGPILTIWSLNTLFPVLNIAISLETWAAAFILFAGISGLRLSNKN